MTGTLRVGNRTKELVKRLRPGDIALLNHADLDATAAQSLIECRVAGVVNAVPSISGRYPNRGPGLLLQAGIPLLDAVGEPFFTQAEAHDGEDALLDGGSLLIGDSLCANGVLMTPEHLTTLLDAARQNLSRELDSFARNTLEYLVEEKTLLLDPVEVPTIRTPIHGRHVLVVVRGEGYKDDLAMISPYIEDVQPVLVGVDGGADALLAAGLKPDIIIGDMDSVSDAGLRCGAELIVHGYARSERGAPGLSRIEALGLSAQVFHAPGTSEDIAILLADEKGASLIVAVGTHFSLEEFLDKGRSGMASTFLVRLRTGAKLVDAKGIGRLWEQRSRPAARELFLLILAALFPVLVIATNSPWLRTVVNTARLTLRSTFGFR